MCARSMSLFGIGVSALAAAFFISHADAPRQRPARPAALTWQQIPTRRWPTPEGTIVLRFAPDAVGPPTLHTVVDAGNGATELWYLPWIHDDPNADPLPSAYVDALADALVHFGTQVDVVGVEGECWEWDLRNDEVSPYAHEALSPLLVNVMRTFQSELKEDREWERLLSPFLRDVAREWERIGVVRAERALLTSTTTPVIGVEDPELLVRMHEHSAKERDPALDRSRSSTAVVVLLEALRARRGRRALLEFGMAHYAEIEDEVRRLGDVTLRAACIPALCEIERP